MNNLDIDNCPALIARDFLTEREQSLPDISWGLLSLRFSCLAQSLLVRWDGGYPWLGAFGEYGGEGGFGSHGGHGGNGGPGGHGDDGGYAGYGRCGGSGDFGFSCGDMNWGPKRFTGPGRHDG